MGIRIKNIKILSHINVVFHIASLATLILSVAFVILKYLTHTQTSAADFVLYNYIIFKICKLA